MGFFGRPHPFLDRIADLLSTTCKKQESITTSQTYEVVKNGLERIVFEKTCKHVHGGK